jgi:hypothetical protein
MERHFRSNVVARMAGLQGLDLLITLSLVSSSCASSSSAQRVLETRLDPRLPPFLTRQASTKGAGEPNFAFPGLPLRMPYVCLLDG